jgi:hypothetical protein
MFLLVPFFGLAATAFLPLLLTLALHELAQIARASVAGLAPHQVSLDVG